MLENVISFFVRNETVVFTIVGVLIGALSPCFVDFINSRRFSKTITASFYAEISSIIALITKRKYRDGMETMLTNINAELERIDRSCHVDARRLDWFAPYLQMINENAFSSIYFNNNRHIGSVDPAIAKDIVEFYVLLHSLLEDAMGAGPKVISDTKSLEGSVSLLSGITDVELYRVRLEALKHYYEEDIVLLDALVQAGQLIINKISK